MESNQGSAHESPFRDLQDLGNRWSTFYRQNPGLLSYGLLALLYILILALFITVFSRSSSGNLQLVSKKEIDDFSSKVRTLSSEMDQLESSYIRKKCKNDWIQFENSCYYISKSTLDWKSARTLCQGKESDLVVINNQRELLFLAGKTNPSSYNRYWLGLHDIDEEGLWKWVDDTNYETSFKAWSEGEPNDKDSEEDCAMMWFNGEWNDVPCNYDNYYALCEQQL
ncbi:hepatic lectin-like [Pyxicephalus adspersus]|uniref:hepatic lectin-like n=1 Tax=Pyxicephalus adspersus TaxID=30357 RepID=UPI003B59398D